MVIFYVGDENNRNKASAEGQILVLDETFLDASKKDKVIKSGNVEASTREDVMEAHNVAFAGSIVKRGRAKGVVIREGSSTVSNCRETLNRDLTNDWWTQVIRIGWTTLSGSAVIIIVGVLFGFSFAGYITSYNLIWATGLLIVSFPMIMIVPYFNYSVKEI